MNQEQIKAELQELTEKPKATEANADVEAQSLARMKAILNEIDEEIKQRRKEEVARVAAVNETHKCCGSCWRRQPKGNDNCELCGTKEWLPADEAGVLRNRTSDIINDAGEVILQSGGPWVGQYIEDHAQRRWKRWAANEATVADLHDEITKQHGPEAIWSVRFAQRHLQLLGEPIPKSYWGKNYVTPEPDSAQSARDPILTHIRERVWTVR